MKTVSVFAPASIGNVGPGFDLLGMAIAGIGDTVVATRCRESGVLITRVSGSTNLPLDPNKNTAGIAAQSVLQHIGQCDGVSLRLHKGVPGSGLGSSAASAVAASYAVNLLFGRKLSKQELVPIAAVAELEVSGGFFLDNIGASMIGGVTWNNPFTQEVVSLGKVPGVVIVIAVPDFSLLTRESRKVLPAAIPMQDFVWNMAYASMITWAAAKNNPERFGRAIQDRVAEPARAPLITGFEDVKEGALAAGAYGCSISGAGASLFAITDEISKGKKIGQAMKKGFAKHHVGTKILVTRIDPQGVRQIK